jgi:predicted TPR repeat methyltransferase
VTSTASFLDDSKDLAMAKQLDGYVKRLTAMGPGETTLEIYEDWAASYESTMIEQYGYLAPRIAADAFEQICPDKQAQVLDMGCGTGLVGVELHARGYQNIDGLDIAQAMLDEAGAKQVYGELLSGDMTKPLDLGGRIYDAAIGVGCFGNGHVGPEHLAELVTSVRPGGALVFYLNGIPYEEDDYAGHFRTLEDAGAWAVSLLEQSNYMAELDRPGWVVAARRGGAA